MQDTVTTTTNRKLIRTFTTVSFVSKGTKNTVSIGKLCRLCETVGPKLIPPSVSLLKVGWNILSRINRHQHQWLQRLCVVSQSIKIKMMKHIGWESVSTKSVVWGCWVTVSLPLSLPAATAKSHMPPPWSTGCAKKVAPSLQSLTDNSSTV